MRGKPHIVRVGASFHDCGTIGESRSFLLRGFEQRRHGFHPFIAGAGKTEIIADPKRLLRGPQQRIMIVGLRIPGVPWAVIGDDDRGDMAAAEIRGAPWLETAATLHACCIP